MNNLLQEFSHLLDEEGVLYGELLEVLKSEKESLLTMDLKRFTGSLEIKQDLLRRLRHLEHRRNELQADLAAQLGLPAETLTMKRLAACLPAREGERLARQRSGFKDIVARVRALQRSNRRLVSHGLALTRNSLRFLQENLADGCVYHAGGKMQKHVDTGRLLSGNV